MSRRKAQQRVQKKREQEREARRRAQRTRLIRAWTYGGLLAAAIVAIVLWSPWSGGDQTATPDNSPSPAASESDGPYKEAPPMNIDPTKTYTATIDTNHGILIAKLYAKEHPVTVNNFVTLARDGFYDGTIFHRVIPDFMIQGGDPTGTGRGGPGYQFEDEKEPFLTFDKPGLLAMANAGPNTNGSQFFITEAPIGHLNTQGSGYHTIFGELTAGLEVVKEIARVQTAAGDKPVQDVVINSIKIEESGA